MSDGSEEVPEWMESRAGIEEHTEKLLRELDQMSEEEYQSRLEEMREEDRRVGRGIDESRSKEETAEFFRGMLGYLRHKREVQSELRDVTDFDDDEWEDGFEYLSEITGDDEVFPTCIECNEVLDPSLDDARIAAEGGVIYTHCSHCGEASIKDNRASNRMIAESTDGIPDAEELELEMSDDVDQEFRNEKE